MIQYSSTNMYVLRIRNTAILHCKMVPRTFHSSVPMGYPEIPPSKSLWNTIKIRYENVRNNPIISVNHPILNRVMTFVKTYVVILGMFWFALFAAVFTVVFIWGLFDVTHQSLHDSDIVTFFKCTMIWTLVVMIIGNLL